MKNNIWFIILICVILALAGYFLLANSQNQGDIKRIDEIPYSSPSETDAVSISPTADNPTASPISTPISSFDQSVPNKTSQTNEPETQQNSSNGALPNTGKFPGNTTENLAYGGQIASDGEYEYILAAVDKMHMSSGSLYKMKSDGSVLQKLTNDTVGSINVVGNWIYYIKWVEYDSKGIFRVKKDGTCNEQVFEGHCASLIVIGDIMFFVNQDDNYNIYRIKTDGSDLELFIEDGAPIQYENGFLYYTDFPDLYRINLANSEREKIAENVESYIINNGSAYYFKRDQKRSLMKKSNVDGQEIILNDNIESHFTISGDKIYFMTEQRGEIFTMDLDGQNITAIPKGEYQPIRQIHGVVGDIIYYWVIFDDLEAGADNLVRMKNDGSFSELLSVKLN